MIVGIQISQNQVQACTAIENETSLYRRSTEVADGRQPFFVDNKPDWKDPSALFDKIVDQLFEICEIKAMSPQKLSIASFGPFENLDPGRPHYGLLTEHQPQRLLNQKINLVNEFGNRFHKKFKWEIESLNERIFINTDVNSAAIAEFFYRSAQPRYPFLYTGPDKNQSSHLIAGTGVAYVTIGDSVGVGFTLGGVRLRGRSHSEMGHVPIQKHPNDRLESCWCDYHTHCVEGLARAIAHKQRKTSRNSEVEATAIRIDYIAQLLSTIHLALSPHLIVVDGPESDARYDSFLKDLRESFLEKMGGEEKFYPSWREIPDLESYIVAPITKDSPLCGALFMATRSYQLSR